MILSDRFDCYDDLVGDGSCDDECNTEDNSWDGGDCCGPDVLNWFCYACECKDPNAEDFGNLYGDIIHETCESWWPGDGSCDDICNNEENGFDGGDCCGDDVSTIWCIECECLEGSEGSEGSKAMKAIKGSKASKASKAMNAMKAMKAMKGSKGSK